MQPELTPTIVIGLLKQTYSGDSTVMQKQAEKRLEALSGQAGFVPALQAIIAEQSIIENVRSAAALYLSRECKMLSLTNKDLMGMLLVVGQLLESGIEISLKRHVCNAIKNLIGQHKSIRLELLGKVVKSMQLLLADSENKEYELESVVFVTIALLQTAGGAPEEKEALIMLVPILYALTIKTTVGVQQLLLGNLEQPVKLRRTTLLREFCRALNLSIKLVSVQQSPQLAVFFIAPNLDTLFASCLQLKLNGSASVFFAHEGDKVSQVLNQLKCSIVQSLDLMLRKISKFLAGSINSQLGSCSTMSNLPKFCQFIFVEIGNCIKQGKYYQLEAKVVNLIQAALKLLKSCLKVPALEPFFSGYRKDILFGVMIPLLELNPEEEGEYVTSPDDFVGYVFGIANREEQEEDEDDQWQMQIAAADLLCTFCTQQHGTLNELFEFALARLSLPTTPPIEVKVLLLVIAIVRDNSKERADIHKSLKGYLDTQLPTLLQPVTSQDELIVRSLKLYVLHKYNLFLSQVDQNYLSVTAQLALTIIQTPSLRDDQVLQIIALDILANICDIGQIVMADSAEQILRALVPLIQQPVNHRLFDTMQQIISSYDQKLSDQAVTSCVRELVRKIETETLSKQPPVVSNKCWNVIRVIGDNDYFIPRLITPIQAEVYRLQKYLQKPEQVEFEQDFLLLCTSFIKRCKQVTAVQLSLFECFAKIFERYNHTFGHMFEAMSYFIFYGNKILKEAPKAVEYAMNICITAISSQSAKCNEADQAQGALILQSLLICCSEAFTQQALWNIVEVVRQRSQSTVKQEFYRGNLLAVLALALSKVWRKVDPGQAELLLTMLLNGAVNIKQAHCSKVLALTLTELLGFEDPIVQAKFSPILNIVIAILTRRLKGTRKNSQQVDGEKVEYGMALQTYKNPTQGLNEYLLFKARFEQLTRQYPQPLSQAIAQLSKDEQNFLRSVIKMDKVAGEARVKLTVKRPTDNS